MLLFSRFLLRRTLSPITMMHAISSQGIAYSSTCPGSQISQQSQHLQVLEAEINKTEKLIQDVGIPHDFPFKLENYPGLQTVSLEREYPDEVIKVKVRKGYTPGKGISPEGEKSFQSYYMNNSITFDVCVAKPKLNERCLEFKCYALPCLFEVDDFVVRNGEYAFKGGYDYDADLSVVIPYYLVVRGVGSDGFRKFMCEYMLNKSRREYLTWLKNVKCFMDLEISPSQGSGASADESCIIRSQEEPCCTR